MARQRMQLLLAATTVIAVTQTSSAQFFRGRGAAVGVNAPRWTTTRVMSPRYSMVTTPYLYNTTAAATVNDAVVYQTQPNVYGQPVTMTTSANGVIYGFQPIVQTSGVMSAVPTAGLPQNTGAIQAGGFVPGLSSQGVVIAGGYVVPQTMPGTVIPTGAMTSNQTVTTQVLAPDGATVTLSGTPSDRTQGVRVFTSPPLDPNKTYVYHAKATWTDTNGRTVTRQKSVDVKAGQQVTIDLTQADAQPSHSRSEDRYQPE